MQQVVVERPAEYVPFGNVATRNGLQERLEIPMMIRALSIPKGLRILEVGCGRGVALPVFLERLEPAELWGVDIDPQLVGLARERIAGGKLRATVVEGDVRALPFESGRFDLVIDFGTCYHVSGGREGAQRALAEIARVLDAAGVFVHETPVAQHLAHPLRSFARTLPWASAPFARDRSALLWSRRHKQVEAGGWRLEAGGWRMEDGGSPLR
jgi:SAM-dependent methyltransferase